MELTTSYNPQQNGVAERKNRTIMEAARAMLHDQDLPMHLWAEDAKIAVYVQNHNPHKVLMNKTPKEVFSDKKPEVIHLRIFGCPVYIHISKEKRTKLDPSGKKGNLWDIVKARRLTKSLEEISTQNGPPKNN